MIRLSSIIQTFEAEFLAQHQEQMLPSHRKALAALEKLPALRKAPKCRWAATHAITRPLFPIPVDIAIVHTANPMSLNSGLSGSSRNTSLPTYFLLTFTLPAQFRSLAWRHQRTFYSLMIQCCWETVRTFSQNDKQLQGIPGAITVLHTHSRVLNYHPHVHLIMPAAAIDTVNRLWRTQKSKSKSKNNVKNQNKSGYLFNHKALAKVFRAKMLEAITQAGLALPQRYPTEWVVDCKSVGTGEKALIYLGRYLYRGVIQEKDILACQDGQVTFRYRNSKTNQVEIKTVSGPKFLSLILRHVLPKGFRRARNFGFLHPNSKRLIQLLQYLLNLDPDRSLIWIRKRPTLACPCCGAQMKIIKTRIPPLFPWTDAVPT